MKNETITFTTASAKSIWDNEIQGQLSDGMWENTEPHNHWRFWHNLTSQVGTDNIVDTKDRWSCRKNGYALKKLVPIIGDRMINLGRMGMVTDNYEALSASEYMPATYEEWLNCKEIGKWQYEFVTKYMDSVDPCMAADFYLVQYEEKDMLEDLKRIKVAMKSVKI